MFRSPHTLNRKHDESEQVIPSHFHADRDREAGDRMPGEGQSDQRALDLIDEASMESFPCSDPPSYTRCHA